MSTSTAPPEPTQPPKPNRGLKELRALLAKRHLCIDDIRRQTFSGHSHLHQVLQGDRKGPNTWDRLLRVLAADELKCAMERANEGLALLSDDFSEGYRVDLVDGEKPSISLVKLKPKEKSST